MWDKLTTDITTPEAQKQIALEKQYGCYAAVAEKTVRLPDSQCYVYDDGTHQVHMALKKNEEGVWILYAGSLGNTSEANWAKALEIAVAKIKDITNGEPIHTGFSDVWKKKNSDGKWLPLFKKELEKQGLLVESKNVNQGEVWGVI